MDTNKFNKGKLYINDECIDIGNLIWHEHPDFKGVFLKHLIIGKNTKNCLSCHLVKINPNCGIGIHKHKGKTELHEIISGNGYCMIEQNKFDYQKGIIGFIPADKNHSVKSGDNGLLLLAKFFPALL